jgi:hypothetical protein
MVARDAAGTRPEASNSAASRSSPTTDHQKRKAIRRRDHDGEPVRDIARSYNVHNSTISRLTT